MDVFSRFLFLTRTCQGSIVRSSPYFGGERESRLGIKPTATSNVSFLTGWISTCRLKPHMITVKIRDVIFFFFFPNTVNSHKSRSSNFEWLANTRFLNSILFRMNLFHSQISRFSHEDKLWRLLEDRSVCKQLTCCQFGSFSTTSWQYKQNNNHFS